MRGTIAKRRATTEMTVDFSTDGARRSTITVECDGSRFEAWTEASVDLDDSATAWLPTVSVTSLTEGHAVSWPGDRTLDRRAFDGADRAKALLASWYSELRSTPGAEPSLTDRPRRGPERGVACFFSGGVDSFYSVVQHDAEITHLVLVHGLDISLDNVDLWRETVERASVAAADLDKELILVRSNVRLLHHDMGPHWQTMAHGAFLAHIALLLAPHVRRVHIPASNSRTDVEPYGTHPALDPLWSSSDVDLVHDDPHTRTRKLRTLSDHPTAMKHLRVCWWNLSTEYNCGRCEKCLRTMIGLDTVDALDRCATLPHTIDPKRVRSMYLTAGGDGGRLYAQENLAEYERTGRGDGEIAQALRCALARGRVANAMVTGRFLGQVGWGLIGHWSRRALQVLRGQAEPPPLT